jgi:carboxylate-amine ligase
VGLQVDKAYTAFQEATDFTVGVEEEFALLDPLELGLVQRFEELREAAAADAVLSEAITGELISSEIEIRSGRGQNLAAATAAQRDRRRRLFALAAERGVVLAATGTHPWSDYREQHIIETEHYQRVEEGLKYVAWRNNTFSLHLHVGIHGADRAVQVCDRLRPVAPLLLAISANSPFLDGRDSGLHSARSQIFTKSFPRCGIPDEFGSWAAFADYIDLLQSTKSIVEYTQVWWSLRPHFAFGTVEVRICDAQSTAAESEGLAALIVACVAQAARDIDAGVPAPPAPRREIEENFWRAIRYGLDGHMIDLDSRQEYPAAEALERLLAWSDPARVELGIEVALPELNGAQRQRRMVETGATPHEVYAATVEETRETYAGALGSHAEVRR